MITVFTAESYTVYLVLPGACYTYTPLFVSGRLLVLTSDILPVGFIYSPYSSPQEYAQITWTRLRRSVVRRIERNERRFCCIVREVQAV